jgi:hypothetical protein
MMLEGKQELEVFGAPPKLAQIGPDEIICHSQKQLKMGRQWEINGRSSPTRQQIRRWLNRGQAGQGQAGQLPD